MKKYKSLTHLRRGRCERLVDRHFAEGDVVEENVRRPISDQAINYDFLDLREAMLATDELLVLQGRPQNILRHCKTHDK